MGRWKVGAGGAAYWDANDDGPNQIAPPPTTTSAPYTPPNGNGGVSNPTTQTPQAAGDGFNPTNRSASSPYQGPVLRPPQGRWKMGPNGPYWDPNDSGADQVTAPANATYASGGPRGFSTTEPGDYSAPYGTTPTPQSAPRPVTPPSTPAPTTPAPSGGPDWNKDYWAPDRYQVLQAKNIQDTYGKVWNGVTWVDAPAPTSQTGTNGNTYQTYGGPIPGSTPGQTVTPNAPAPAGTYQPQTYQGATTTTPQGIGAPPPGFDQGKWNDPNHQTDKYRAGRYMAQHPTASAADVAAYLGNGYTAVGTDTIRDRDGNIIDIRFDQEGANRPQWLMQDNGSGGSGSGGRGAGTPGAGTPGSGLPGAGGTTTGTGPISGNANVFTDPATREWEVMLRQLVDKMNQAQPGWSNAQMEIMQTQALDPLERQRQAMKQQQTQRLAARGIAPGSGLFESAMADIDRQFNQMRVQQQNTFANTAIGREDALFNSNEARAINAQTLLKQLPQLADSRLAQAQGQIIPTNPAQLIQLAQQQDAMANQQAGYNQAAQQQFMAQLMSIFSSLFA